MAVEMTKNITAMSPPAIGDSSEIPAPRTIDATYQAVLSLPPAPITLEDITQLLLVS